MKERNYNLDLIRCVAVIFVISVHFFLNSGFYDIICVGKRMLIMSICVQLLLLVYRYF